MAVIMSAGEVSVMLRPEDLRCLAKVGTIGWKTPSYLITFNTAVDGIIPFAGSNKPTSKIKMQNKFLKVKLKLSLNGPKWG